MDSAQRGSCGATRRKSLNREAKRDSASKWAHLLIRRVMLSLRLRAIILTAVDLVRKVGAALPLRQYRVVSMSARKRQHVLHLPARDLREIKKELKEPSADTPERRSIFSRAEAQRERLKRQGFEFDDERLKKRTPTG